MSSLLVVSVHPLRQLLLQCAAGRFPEPDGGWHRVPPWREDVVGAVAFTGHAVFAVRGDVTDATLRTLGADGFGGAHHPRLIAEVAGPDGWIDEVVVTAVAPGNAASLRTVLGAGFVPVGSVQLWRREA